jgi:siderophore synthetase component
MNNRYVICFLKLVLAPLLKHGICLEAHGQNMVARINLKTKTITGFAVRDFGGLRLHMPTLHNQGYRLDAVMPGSAITTNDIHDVWSKAHHTIFQSHLGTLLYALHLEHEGGWAMVREEMTEILSHDGGETGRKLLEFFLRPNMPFKCFIRMKLEGKYRDVGAFPWSRCLLTFTIVC